MIELLVANDVGLVEEARTLFREYADGLGVDLCFQGFDKELAELPGSYGSPAGILLLARHGGRLAGCCALRPCSSKEHPNAAEMKRLYVRPEFRGTGLGRKLVDEILQKARAMNYKSILLDTLPTMGEAQDLYRKLGFREIAPYYQNPVSGARFLKLDF